MQVSTFALKMAEPLSEDIRACITDTEIDYSRRRTVETQNNPSLTVDFENKAKNLFSGASNQKPFRKISKDNRLC